MNNRKFYVTVGGYPSIIKTLERDGHPIRSGANALGHPVIIFELSGVNVEALTNEQGRVISVQSARGAFDGYEIPYYVARDRADRVIKFDNNKQVVIEAAQSYVIRNFDPAGQIPTATVTREDGQLVARYWFDGTLQFERA
jgi:hypothetical protein